MRKNLKELAEDGVYFIVMIVLFTASYVEEAYSWLRYRRPAENSLQDSD